VVEARAGVTHKFSDDVLAKVKVNQEGKVDFAWKFKVCDTTHAIVTSGINVKSFADQKSKPLPVGVSFDIKF